MSVGSSGEDHPQRCRFQVRPRRRICGRSILARVSTRLAKLRPYGDSLECRLAESPSRDPIDGELAEPPPSDLSEYTWDDSDTERLEPAPLELATRAPQSDLNRSIGDDFGRFVDTLIQSRTGG